MQKDLHDKFIPGKTRIKYGGAVTGPEEMEAINKVLNRNWWTLDEEGRLFEQELAETSGVKFATFTNSGSSALFLAFGSLNLPPGSEVIIPAVNFPTIVSSALLLKLKPVFVDVDPTTYCIDPKLIEKAISKNTKVIAVVNIAGNIPDIKEIVKIAKKNNLITLLDNCDGYGSTFDEKPIETFFDLSATSFHAAHIITTGEGGAVFTDNELLYRQTISLREWGRDLDSDIPAGARYEEMPDDYPSRYTYITAGLNLKPIELQAAMGRVQLKRLQTIRSSRMANFQRIFAGLSTLSDYLTLPAWHPLSGVSWYSFPLTLKAGLKRQEIISFLEKRNIETRMIFAGNITKQPAYKNADYRISGSLKNSDQILHNSFFISVHPSVTTEMIDYITDSFTEYFTMIDKSALKITINGRPIFVPSNGISQINISTDHGNYLDIETTSKDGKREKRQIPTSPVA